MPILLVPMNHSLSALPFGGLARTVQKENSKFSFKIVEFQTSHEAQTALPLSRKVDILLAEAQTENDNEVEVRYEGERRWIKRLREFNLEAEAKLTDGRAASLKEKGVYIITGGAGGLGLIFAGYLAGKVKARLVLTGRSELSDKKQARIRELESLGSEVAYIRADISSREEVRKLITEAKSRFGEIQGIIHSAGVIRDAYIIGKSQEDMDAVLAPKVFGTVYLDEATRGENLDFFVLFSSIAGAIGNPGQIDYAYANSFMDNFALMREGLRRKGSRAGRTLSINWPLWREGGMKVDENIEKALAKTLGMWPLRTEAGLNTFTQGLASEETQFLAVEGDQQKLRQLLGKGDESSWQEDEGKIPPKADEEDLLEKIQKDIVRIASEILKIQETSIDVNKDMNEYGFDSITLTDLTNRVNARYGLEIAISVFFEHSSISASAKYLGNEYRDSFLRYYQDSLGVGKPVKVDQDAPHFPVLDEEGENSHHPHPASPLKGEERDGCPQQGWGTSESAAYKVEPGSCFHTVFLTGATGILGGYILKELLETTDSRIYCLIRANDTVHAQERLRKILAIYGADDRVLSALNHRVLLLIGDVSKDNLGLSGEEYRHLAESIDCAINIKWLSKGSKKILEASKELGYKMEPMPKFMRYNKCRRCGMCHLGCPYGAKWTSLDYLDEAVSQGADVRYETVVERVLLENGKAVGVKGKGPKGRVEIFSDVVILAAGGLGTPVILQKTGIEDAGSNFFGDLLMNTYGVTKDLSQLHEPVKALVDTEFHKSKGFILSTFLQPARLHRFVEAGVRGVLLPTDRTLGIMTKSADDQTGRVYLDGSYSKVVTEKDRARLREGSEIAKEILIRAGVDSKSIVVGNPVGAHPGGTAAIGKIVNSDLKTEIDNLYVCDASVFPRSVGAPPILTIAALAKRLAKTLVSQQTLTEYRSAA
ncbi:MAG: SDR family NAD(P)-dependent oxidoreductase [bacterium]